MEIELSPEQQNLIVNINNKISLLEEKLENERALLNMFVSGIASTKEIYHDFAFRVENGKLIIE